MKLFLKYFFLGCLGLILSLSFPQLRVSWLTILLAWGYARHGNRLAIPLAIFLPLLYSIFSLFNFWSLFIPLLLSLLFLEGVKKHFSLPHRLRLGMSLLLFWSCQWWSSFPIHEELMWGGITIVAGFLVPPLLKRISYISVSPWKSDGTLIRDSAWGLDAKRRGSARNPFGFEKGF